MSEFVLTGSDVFGRYCRIEQLRFGVPNEMFLYKVVASLRSNCWCEVPYKTASKEVRHDSIEDCVLAICCGIDETEVLRFRMADVEFLPHLTCDCDALLALAEEINDTSCDNHGELSVSLGDIWGWSQAISEALGGGIMSDIDWRRKLADGLRIDLDELETVVEEMHAAFPDSRDSAMYLIEDWEGRIRAAIGEEAK